MQHKVGMYQLFPQVFKNEAHHPWPLIFVRWMNPSQCPEFAFREITFFTTMNWLMNIVAWWRVSPIGYSAFNEPGSSPTTFLSCPTGIVVWWEIHPKETPWMLLSQFPLHRSMKGHRLNGWQRKHTLHVREEETTFSKLTKPFVAAIIHHYASLLTESLKKIRLS